MRIAAANSSGWGREDNTHNGVTPSSLQGHPFLLIPYEINSKKTANTSK